MKYLITGITGFVGPALASLLLSENHEVHGLIRGTNGREMDLMDTLTPDQIQRIVFHKCDLQHFAGIQRIIMKNQYDGIFHLAAQSHPSLSFDDPIMTFQDNVMGTVNLIEALTGSDTVLHMCSTSEVYGNFCKTNGVVKETDPMKPINPYACSKAAMDLYVQERIANGFIMGFITRSFSHTGPRRGKNFSISSDAYQLALIKMGLQEPVLKVGNLETERVVIDVRDVVKAYYLLMRQPIQANGQIFNVCGTEVRKMEYFTDTLIDIARVNVEKVIHEQFYRKVDIQLQIGDSSKLKVLTDWSPQIPISVTLRNLYVYWLGKIQ